MQTFKIEKTDSQCVVTWNHFSYIAFAAIGGFLIFGVVFSEGRATYVQEEVAAGKFPVIVGIIAAVLVWGFELFIFMIFIHVLFGKTKFVLNEDGLDATYTCLLVNRKKWFDLDEIHSFEKKIHFHPKNQSYFSLRVACQDDNASQTFCLATRITTEALEKEIGDLCKQLNAFLKLSRRRNL
jgi:hypothetical protein